MFGFSWYAWIGLVFLGWVLGVVLDEAFSGFFITRTTWRAHRARRDRYDVFVDQRGTIRWTRPEVTPAIGGCYRVPVELAPRMVDELLRRELPLPVFLDPRGQFEPVEVPELYEGATYLLMQVPCREGRT
jgi:hypothetical protein